jgi:hypothetical protein
LRRFSHATTFPRNQRSTGWPGSFLVHDRKGENVRTSRLLADNANAGNGELRFHRLLYRAAIKARQGRKYGWRMAVRVAKMPHKECVKHDDTN